MATPSNPQGGKTQGAGGNSDPPLHPLVEKVVLDPDKPADVVALLGYLGSAGKGREHFRRIYLDSGFQTYYEIHKDDILRAAKADPSAEHQPTQILIKASAKLSLVQTVEASFLRGPITSKYPLGSAPGGNWTAITTLVCEWIEYMICPGGTPHTSHYCVPETHTHCFPPGEGGAYAKPPCAPITKTGCRP
jgi:hypothetical protein